MFGTRIGGAGFVEGIDFWTGFVIAFERVADFPGEDDFTGGENGFATVETEDGGFEVDFDVVDFDRVGEFLSNDIWGDDDDEVVAFVWGELVFGGNFCLKVDVEPTGVIEMSGRSLIVELEVVVVVVDVFDDDCWKSGDGRGAAVAELLARFIICLTVKLLRLFKLPN